MHINDFWNWAKTRAGHKHEPPERLLQLASLGLTGEAGEFADLIKKHVYHEHPLDKQEALSELGDVLWYIGLASETLGFTLEDVAQSNRQKLLKRYPNGFNPADSLSRTPEAKPEPPAELVALQTLGFAFDLEADGRHICEFPELPGAMAYGASPMLAATACLTIVLRVLQGEADHG